MALILTNKSATAIPRSILYVTCSIDIESVTILNVIFTFATHLGFVMNA